MTDHSIRGKVALIAGGAKNLGGLIARDLAQQGAAAVAIHYNSDASRADAEDRRRDPRCRRARRRAAGRPDHDGVERLFADTVAAVGRPDIAINTVGKVLKSRSRTSAKPSTTRWLR